MIKNFIPNRHQQKISVIVEINKNSRGLAFVMHGLSGNKEQPHIQAFADVFKAKGLTVVRFDATNSFGESDGDYKKATLTNYYQDLEDIIAWAKKQNWYRKPFILSGHSLGGFCAAYYAENHPQEVLAIAPISPFISGKLDYEVQQRYNPERLNKWQVTGWLIEESLSRPGLIKHLPWSHMEDRFKHDLLPQIRQLTMPVLLIVGEEDFVTPVETVKKLYNLLPGKKELHVIKGASHYLLTEKILKQVRPILLSWIDKII